MSKAAVFLGAVLLLCAGISYAPTAYADNDVTGTGNELIQYCNQSNFNHHNALWDICDMAVDSAYGGYLLGVLVSNKNLSAKQLNIASGICPPGNPIRGQLALMVSKYLRDNPSKLDMPCVMLITLAIIVLSKDQHIRT